MTNNTRVHCVDDKGWQIWVDTDIGKRDGICLASENGKNLEELKKEAIHELKCAIKFLEKKEQQK